MAHPTGTETSSYYVYLVNEDGRQDLFSLEPIEAESEEDAVATLSAC
jgi:hypothetical protein